LRRSICSSRQEFPATEVRLDAVMLVVQWDDLSDDGGADAIAADALAEAASIVSAITI
jgi:hypothetical protein